MARTKANKALKDYERRLVEVDGEFCIPQDESQARHYIDLGPIFGEVERSGWYLLRKLLLFVPAMFLFIFAIQLMKAGAQAVGPSIEGQFPFANPVSTLGTGWLGAYFVLSGSPVAATTISLFGAGTITDLETLTMLSGSRMGASFIVLVTGFLYAMRHKGDRAEGLGIGVQAMTMTAIQYLPGMLIAFLLMSRGTLDGIDWHASGSLDAVLSALWGPLVDVAEANLPGWGLFLVGVVTILLSFNLIDRILPHVDSDSTASKRTSWLKRPWTMFLLGCLVATLTLSVSVALTVLVPLAVKGYVKRDEALPYIMGANITTLADTLVVAMLQPTPEAARIVLAEAIGVAIVSIFILAVIYGPVKRAVLNLEDSLVTDNRRLAVFVAILFVVPIALICTGLFWTVS
jgi:solute carrier family 34 (sodium-dependent phosphate cotransporter)